MGTKDCDHPEFDTFHSCCVCAENKMNALKARVADLEKSEDEIAEKCGEFEKQVVQVHGWFEKSEQKVRDLEARLESTQMAEAVSYDAAKKLEAERDEAVNRASNAEAREAEFKDWNEELKADAAVRECRIERLRAAVLMMHPEDPRRQGLKPGDL